MSTILEALKKSEQERKLNQLPTLSDMPTPQEPSRLPVSLLVVAVLLLLVLIGLALTFWWPNSTNPATQDQGLSNSQATNTNIQSELEPQSIIVSVVSYSDQPQKRFVIVDGKLYRENEFVRAGLKVEEIRPNDVVLNLRGQKITRQP